MLILKPLLPITLMKLKDNLHVLACDTYLVRAQTWLQLTQTLNASFGYWCGLSSQRQWCIEEALMFKKLCCFMTTSQQKAG